MNYPNNENPEHNGHTSANGRGGSRGIGQCPWSSLLFVCFIIIIIILLLLLIWQSPGLPGWRKVNLITVTRRPLHPNIAAGFYCLTTSPGFLPALCEKWSGFIYVHRVWLSYTRDRQLTVSSERLGNEDKAPCPRALLPGRGLNRGPPVWKSEVLTARPRQLLKSKAEAHLE